MSENFLSELLIVDDDVTRELSALQLSTLGYRVSSADSGLRALELIASQRFNLVLLDIDMPGRNGLDVVAEIRRTHSALTLPVIMVTADDQTTSVVEALRRGANDYLIKPINMPVAAARIRTQLALCELVRLKGEFLSFASHDLKKPLMLAEDVLQQIKTMFVPGSPSPPLDMLELLELLLHSNRNMQNVVRSFLDANARSEGIA